MNRFLLPFLLFFITFSDAGAQKKVVTKKYPSLFWEITGHGLKKPSYLFGTMHVSSKMVFHLSDSFYHAMRNTDAVALELNPEIWQDEMFRLQKAQANLSRFSLSKMNDYLSESSFRLEKYEDNIKQALTEEPTVVNNLLYRSYQPNADYEENTYLDLYIYQTGRKLGKRPAGVENYLESEKLMMEAFKDMAKDKVKPRSNDDGESYYDVQTKIQSAYRNGDLDLLDSLQNLSSMSASFSEKFLYLRNEIQANSIDTIIKKHSLFVSVGAAHLPGYRGVIELLRKKGYHLRPIFMQDRDASQKETIDKLKVPVTFKPIATPDGAIQLSLPGELYKREESRTNDSWQYADMNNGSYYMLTRVLTHAAMWGHGSKTVYDKVDSMLYENIPGKILKKTSIVKNGYKGFDITNRTRRGDLQRYQILVTPYEVLVFKMSGNDNYADGSEADIFFNSIKIRNNDAAAWISYEPVQGGFSVQLPATPNISFSKQTGDGIEKWDYDCVDSKTGNAYNISTKSLYNFNFIEEDTFDLALMEESLKSSEIIQKQKSRKMGIENNYPFLESSFTLQDDGMLYSKAFIKGAHYYLLTVRAKENSSDVAAFFNSFKYTTYRYPEASRFTDSLLRLEVVTSVKPNIDTLLRSWLETAGNDALPGGNDYSGWPKDKTGIFQSDSTGESILVNVKTFPKYYYSRDSSKFWKDKLEEKETDGDLVFSRKEFFKINNSACGYNIVLTDTNSARCIRYEYLLKGNSLYKFSTITDTSSQQSDFINSFFATAKPLANADTFSVFKNKLDVFFKDYYSKDSAATKQAKQAISNIYFGSKGIDKLLAAIGKCKFGDKDYFETKSKLIAELGFIDDTLSNERLVKELKNIYDKSGDTSSFQNPVLNALANIKTASSFSLLKEILIQDPPVFEDSYEYEQIFTYLNDTLKLARSIFPAILQLSALDDYKPHVNSLLKSLVDSGYIKGEDYENYFSTLFFDAKIELKKQQIKDEKQLQQEDGDDDNDNNDVTMNYYHSARSSSSSELTDYAVLLMPFYNTHAAVSKFFEKLLSSKDEDVQLEALRVMLGNNKAVPDSLIISFASKNQFRARLYEILEKTGRTNLFPAKYKTSEWMAKSLLLGFHSSKDFSDIQLVKKQFEKTKDASGNVYFFKYKLKKQDDWKMGISGFQPLNPKKISTEGELVKLTNKTIKTTTPELNQYEEQLKRLLMEKHKSSQNFYERNNLWNFREGSYNE